MELNDTENVFPYIRSENNGDPPNLAHILNNRQLGIKRSPVNQLKQFAELKTTLSEMTEIQCEIPQSARSTFLMTFNSDCTKVASTHGDHNIYVCDVQSGKRLNKLVGHRRTPWCISFHPVLKDVLASGCLAGEVRVWDLHGGSERWQADSDQVISSLAFHPFAQLLVIATGNSLYFWDWSKSEPIASISTYSELEKVRFVKFDSRGDRLITGITNMSGNKSGKSGMRSALRSCVRLPPESVSHLSRSHQRTDSDRLRGTSEERSRSPRENAGEGSARTRSPVGGSIFPLRQDAVERFIRYYRGERMASQRPERFSSSRADGSSSNQGETSSNRSEMSTSNREDQYRAEESTSNAVEGEPRSYLRALIQDIENDLRESNLPEGNPSLGSLESVQQNSSRTPQSAPGQYVDGIHRIIVEELNPMMADIRRLSASVAEDLDAIGVNVDLDDPQPSTSTGQSRRNNNKFDFLARSREPDSQFFANSDFWGIFRSLRNICSDLERRLRNVRSEALEVERATFEDSEVPPLSSEETMERELRSPLTPIIEMLSRLQVDLTFSAITVGAVQNKIGEIRRELAETLSRIRNYMSGRRGFSTVELDIFQDMAFQITEYLDKIIEAEDLLLSTNYVDDMLPSGLRRSSGRGTPIIFDEANLAHLNSSAELVSDPNAEHLSQERSLACEHHLATLQHDSESSTSATERGSALTNQAVSQSNITSPSINHDVSVRTNLDSEVSANSEAGLSRSVEAFLEFSRRTQEVCDMVTAMETSVAERDEQVTRGQTSSHNSSLSQNHETVPNSRANELNSGASSVSPERSSEEPNHIDRHIQSPSFETRVRMSNSHNPVHELSVGETEASSSSTSVERAFYSTISEMRNHIVPRNQHHHRSSFDARYRRHHSSVETRRQRQRRIQRASETISLERQRSPGHRSLSSRIIDLIARQNIDTEASSRSFNTASSFLSRHLRVNESVFNDDMDSINTSAQSAPESVQIPGSSTLSLSTDTEGGPVSNEELYPSDHLQTTDTSQSMHQDAENLERPHWPSPINRNSFMNVYPSGNRHMDVASQSTQTPATSMPTSETAEQSQPADLSDFSEEEMSWSLLDGTNTSPATSPEESNFDFFTALSRSESTRSALRDIIDRLPPTGPRPGLFSAPGLGASAEPVSDPSSDESDRPTTPPILMYAPNFTNLLFSRNPRIAYNDPLTQNHRIQVWDFSNFQLPPIYEASTNVVVKRCMIHNDASIDISQDGEKLVALIPPEDRDPFNNLMFGIFSLRPGQIGRILCIWGYISNAISVSLSPLADYVIVGSAYSRPVYTNPEKAAVAQIIKINQSEDRLYDASYIRSFTQIITNENRFQQMSLNCVKWLPQSGLGVAYATNRGALCICKPVAGEWRSNSNDENEAVRDPRSSIYWVNTVNWALMRMWSNDEI